MLENNRVSTLNELVKDFAHTRWQQSKDVSKLSFFDCRSIVSQVIRLILIKVYMGGIRN